MAAQSVFPTLELVRDCLAAVEGVRTCRIGMEKNMTPDAYPMVRVVPSRLTNGAFISERAVDALIYFGQPIHEFTGGAEEQWRDLLAMEAELLQALGAAPFGFHHAETVLDEDRIEAYKLLAIRCTIEA